MTPSAPLAVHAITRGGVELGGRLAAALGADLLVAEALAPDAPVSARSFPLPMKAALAPAFPAYRGHVFVMAVGAVVRMIAPLLGSKWSDPAVVCVDEAGRYAVSVLSGHTGGGNALARDVARILGGEAVVTTVSDVLDTLRVDLLGRDLGWTLEDPHGNATRASAAVVNGAPVLLVQEAGEPDFWPGDRAWLSNVARRREAAGADLARFEAVLLVTDRLLADAERDLARRAVLYRPRSLALGVGCDRGAPPDMVARGVEALLERHRLSPRSVREIATIDLKADEPALLALARELACPLRTFPAAALDAARGVANPSATVQRLIGTRGVAEPAALLASRATSLLVPKTIYTEPGAGRSMTVAVARFSLEERTHGDG